MCFNIGKCKKLHVYITRKKNKIDHTYLMSNPSATTGTVKAAENIHKIACDTLVTQPPNGSYTPLEVITSDKYLGVTLDHHLTFNEHVDTITRKASTVLNLCRRNLHMCSKDTKELAYKAMIRLLLEYASPAWNPHTSRNINKIEQVQRRSARFVLNNYEYGPDAGLTDKICNELKWLSLQHRRAQNDLTTFYKIRKQSIHMPFPSSVRASSIHPHKYLHIQGLSSAAYLNSFYPRTIRIWNLLPRHIIQPASLAQLVAWLFH